MMAERITLPLSLRRAFKRMSPAHIASTLISARTIKRFADSVGMVYFGHVDQRQDDHKPIRGHTTSNTHIDSNYCVGRIKDYDCLLVTRNDTRLINGYLRHYHWLVMSVELHSVVNIPHMYVGYHANEAEYAHAPGSLPVVYVPQRQSYPHEFVQHYVLHGSSAHAMEIGALINKNVADVLLSHFGGASVEIIQKTLYVYIDTPKPTEQQLQSILSNTVWLAETIDTAIEYWQQQAA